MCYPDGNKSSSPLRTSVMGCAGKRTLSDKADVKLLGVITVITGGGFYEGSRGHQWPEVHLAREVQDPVCLHGWLFQILSVRRCKHLLDVLRPAPKEHVLDEHGRVKVAQASQEIVGYLRSTLITKFLHSKDSLSSLHLLGENALSKKTFKHL